MLTASCVLVFQDTTRPQRRAVRRCRACRCSCSAKQNRSGSFLACLQVCARHDHVDKSVSAHRTILRIKTKVQFKLLRSDVAVPECSMRVPLRALTAPPAA